jgi:hypothetical protein
VSADFLGGSNDTLVDRIFRALTAVLALVLSLTFLAGGVALALYPNPKVGNVGNAIAADIFLTLGVTSFVDCCPGSFRSGRSCDCWLTTCSANC